VGRALRIYLVEVIPTMTTIAQNKQRVKNNRQEVLIPADQRLRIFADVTIVPNDLIRDPNLSPGAKTLWLVLWSYCFHSAVAFPGLDTIAAQIGVSPPTVIAYRKELEGAGLLRVTRRGRGRTNLYELFAPPHPSQQCGSAQENAEFKNFKARVQESLNQDDTDSALGNSDNAPFSHFEEVQEEEAQDHHDMTADADDAGVSFGNDDGGRRAFILRLLRELGDDHPEQVIDWALSAGWDLDQLADGISRVAELNGRLRNKPGWLRTMLPKGPAAFNAALDRLGAPRPRAQGGDVNNAVSDLDRLRKRYAALLFEYCSRGTPEERKQEVAREGRQVRAELERRGVDVNQLQCELYQQWGWKSEDEAGRDGGGPRPGEIPISELLKQLGVSSLTELIENANKAG